MKPIKDLGMPKGYKSIISNRWFAIGSYII